MTAIGFVLMLVCLGLCLCLDTRKICEHFWQFYACLIAGGFGAGMMLAGISVWLWRVMP